MREVNNMTGMFSLSGLMDSGIGNWALTSLTRAPSMFERAPLSSALDFSRWRMPNARSIKQMFLKSGVVDSGVWKWTLPAGTHTLQMFEGTRYAGKIGDATWTDEQKRDALRGALPVEQSGTKYGRRGDRTPRFL